jgi:hypothetical protein
MTSHAAEAAAKANAANAASLGQLAPAQLPSQPAHCVVAASGGSVTRSREPLGERAKSTDSYPDDCHPDDTYPKPIPVRVARPTVAPPFAKVSMATRIPAMAEWIAARPNFTFAEAHAASAPSPCSPTVMAYTLPDARLGSALAQLGYFMTAGGKNGYTVTAIKATGKR